MIGTTGGAGLGRRGFLRMAGAAAAMGAAGLAAGCGSAGDTATSASSGPTIRLGVVSPTTGPLAPFGAADTFVIAAMRQHFARNPITVGGRSHQVEILNRDSQSNANRAGDVAGDLILNAGIHLMLVAGTPDTAGPVSAQCEAAGLPCVAAAGPWQAWVGVRGRTNTALTWTHCFAWGLEDIASVYADMWDEVATNKIAGGLWPDDPDGRSWGDPTTGLPATQSGRGYKVLGQGNYPAHSQDFSRLIGTFRTRGSQILVGAPTAADFGAFWSQAARRDYRPRIATIGRALAFPAGVEALGELGENLCTDVSWSPGHPYTSSLTGQSAQQLAAAYTVATGEQWVQPIGSAHALFEVAALALSAVSTPDDRDGLIKAMSALRADTVAGPLDWTRGPAPHVAGTPLVGGQWRKGTSSPFELVVVSNNGHPEIPVAGAVRPLGGQG